MSNKDILSSFYEDWALLRDDEKNSMLPNMAAGKFNTICLTLRLIINFVGLGAILFAVNIDKPELNSGSVLQKMDKLAPRPEPIIEAPIVGMIFLIIYFMYFNKVAKNSVHSYRTKKRSFGEKKAQSCKTVDIIR